MKEYALYKGEELLALGTIREIARQLNIKENTVRRYGSPSQAEKNSRSGIVLITLDDEEQEGQF